MIAKHKHMRYNRKILDIVNNQNNCIFYKMEIDGECPFDKFTEDVERVAIDKKHLVSIYAMMDTFNPNLRYPKTKLNHINSNIRGDIYEFKKDNLRVYVLLQKPNVLIVMGGYKIDQKQDVKRVDRLIKELPKDITTINLIQ